MALKVDTNLSAIAYHIVDGPVTFPYAIDARSAVGRFPDHWSFDPWSAADMVAARAASGEPEIELTDQERAAIEEHAIAVAEAGERLKAFREKQAAEKAEADQATADEALVASPPPRPEVRRAPTPAQARKLAARSDQEIAAEKAHVDQTGTT